MKLKVEAVALVIIAALLGLYVEVRVRVAQNEVRTEFLWQQHVMGPPRPGGD